MFSDSIQKFGLELVDVSDAIVVFSIVLSYYAPNPIN